MTRPKSISKSISKDREWEFTDVDFLVEQEHKLEEDKNMRINKLIEDEEKEWSMIEYEAPKENYNPDKYGCIEDDEEDE